MIFKKLIIKEDDVLKLIYRSILNKENILVTYLNQHCFNLYNSNSEYNKLLDNSFNVFLDGFGIYTSLKFLGYKNVQKFNATDIYYKIFRQFSANNTKLFLIGGKFADEIISEKVVEKKLNICGYQKGYFKDEDINKIVESIQISSAEAVIIAMGVPLQEFAAAKISESVKNIPFLCVGGFLEFYFGMKKRAPKFLRKIGLEWLHRLLMEPKRMWKRYLIGIPVFIFQVLKIKLSNQ